MQLTIKCLNSLQPTTKLKRTILDCTNIYIEQRSSGYSLMYKYQSPVTHKTRYMKLQRFTYKEQVTKKDIVNIEKRVDILAGEIAKDKDPLMAKQAVKDQAIQERVDSKLNIKLDEAFRKYSESEQFELMADSTQYRYLQTYNNHIKPVFGKNSVQDYTRGKVQLFLDKKSRGTQRICLAILKNVENWLLKNDIIESNRLQAILKKPAGKKRTSIDDRTLAELLNSLDNNRNIDQAIKMQLLTGCRINEVLRATWDEIDFKNKLWTIPWEHIKTERKSTNSNRTHVLPITGRMMEVLLLQKQHGTDGRIFKGCYRYNKIPLSTVNNKLHQFNCSSHILRKTVGTNILSALKLGSMELKLILNHAIVEGSDKEYVDEHEQFLDRKTATLQAWHSYLDSLCNASVKESNVSTCNS